LLTSCVSFIVVRPSTGVSFFDEELTDLTRKYSPVSAEEAG